MADVEIVRVKHTCRECGKSYNKNWRLEEHIRSHTGERPYKCAFEGCDKSFIRPYHLKRHAVIHSGEQGSFKCSHPGCTKSFFEKQTWKRHEQRSHNHPFKCGYEGCNQSFKKSSQLKKHTCLHTNESLFMCQVEGCNRGFDSAPRLRRHMKIHNKGYMCSVPGCAETFDKFSKLAIHVRSHGFVCEVCKKTFSRTWELKRHARLHSSDRKMYECPREGCSRVYTKAFNLRVHIKAYHEGNKPYLCTVEGCDKGFAHKVSLKQHMILHSQNKINLKAPSRGQSAQKKKSKKKRRPITLANKLSGYRSSSLSESSDTRTSEAGSRRRKSSRLAQNKTGINTVTANNVHDRTASQSNTASSRNVEESTTSLPSINAANSHENPVTTAVNMDLPEEVRVDSSPVPSGAVRLSNTPAVDKQHGTSSELSSNLVPAVLTEEMEESHSVAPLSKWAPPNMGIETVTNSNSSQRICVENTPAANDDVICTFSSSDEEGMDWELAGCNALTEVDSENEIERMENSRVSSHSCSANELDSDDGRLVIDCDALAEVDSENEIERMEKDATRSQNSANELDSDDGRLVINFGGSSSNAISQLPSTLSSVNSKESNKVIGSSHVNRDAESVTHVSRLMGKADISAKKKHKSKKRKRKDVKKSRRNESRAECESTDFPGLDDVLQVIIEEESQICDQTETRSESDHLHLEHDDSANSPAAHSYCSAQMDSRGRSMRTEKRVTSLDEEEMNVENHTLRRPYQEETTGEIHNGVHQAPIVSEIPSSTISEEGSLPIEQDFVEYDSVVDLGNDDDISSDENVMNISQQTIAPHVDVSPIAQVARDNETEQEDCPRGLTPESRELMGNSPGVSRDHGEVSRDKAAASPASQSLEETTENKGREDKISNNVEVTRTRPQCPNKRTIENNERNVGSKTANNRSSLIPAKHTATNATKSNNSEVEDINVGLNNSETVSKKSSQKNDEQEDSQTEFSKPKFRSRTNIFTCDLQTLELLWNFKGK